MRRPLLLNGFMATGKSSVGRALAAHVGRPFIDLDERIDEISATLGSTGQWIADQQQTIGAMDDLISEPPPLASQTRVRQTQ